MDKLTRLNKAVDAKLKRLAAVKVPKNAKEYEAEVEKLEDQGMSTSDAQGVVDAAMKKAGVKLSKKLASGYQVKWKTFIKHPSGTGGVLDMESIKDKSDPSIFYTGSIIQMGNECTAIVNKRPGQNRLFKKVYKSMEEAKAGLQSFVSSL
jgi:hypothetical protein